MKRVLLACVLATAGAAAPSIPVAADPLRPQGPRTNSMSDGCLQIPSNICVQNGAQQITALPAEKDLALSLTFDDAKGHDYSGRDNHLATPHVPGPAQYGHGNSAFLDGNTGLKIKNGNGFGARAATISFWIFLLEDSKGAWRSILAKGSSMSDHTPEIMLWPKERRIHARVSTDMNINEGLDSVTKLKLKRWTHVAYMYEGKLLSLFINGVKDSEVILKGTPLANNGTISIGKDTHHAGTKCFMDDFKWYSRALDDKDIRMMADGSLPAVGPQFVQLGCRSCDFETAQTSCTEGYHICTTRELYASAFKVASGMGWLEVNNAVWSRNTTTASPKTDKRLGLCCTDN